MSEITMAAIKFAQGLRETADYLNDAVFSDDIAAMRDALELGRNKLRQAAEALEEAERERDAAVRDIEIHDGCEACKHADLLETDSPCRECLASSEWFPLWQWRGPCAENGGAEDD